MNENPPHSGPLVRVDQVEKVFHRGSEDIHMLAHLSLEVARGEFLALWAGQNAPLVKHETARALMAFLVEDTEKQLARLAALVPKR